MQNKIILESHFKFLKKLNKKQSNKTEKLQ